VPYRIRAAGFQCDPEPGCQGAIRDLHARQRTAKETLSYAFGNVVFRTAGEKWSDSKTNTVRLGEVIEAGNRETSGAA